MTIKDLARETGYSMATISRVLNNNPRVSKRAREEITRAVEASGFQLNANAKQLKQHANSILVIVKGTSNELFAQMVVTIQNLIAQTAYPLHVDYMDEDHNEVLRAVQLCREKKPLGILFLGGNKKFFEADFGKIDIPCVLVSNDASGLLFTNLSSVATDDRQASFCAMEALIALGHRKFALIGGDRSTSDTSRLRYEGCLQAFKRHDIAFDEENYCDVRFSYQDGYNAARQLIDKGRAFTALFAQADVLAIGAIRALRDQGLRVPEDVSVMGFDGLPIGAFFAPRLATVVQSAQAMAQRGVEILLERIEASGEACHESAPYELLLGESVQHT